VLEGGRREQVGTWLTRTNEVTEGIVRDMMQESSDKQHKAAGAQGTRYCPSLEAKVSSDRR
jgi:tRNA U34 5-carboxymethylaminomethyl modifying enzyme MnmG/GidA